MSTVQTMVKLITLPRLLEAAKLLEANGLLTNGETAADVVKRYVNANPDINEALAKGA